MTTNSDCHFKVEVTTAWPYPGCVTHAFGVGSSTYDFTIIDPCATAQPKGTDIFPNDDQSIPIEIASGDIFSKTIDIQEYLALSVPAGYDLNTMCSSTYTVEIIQLYPLPDVDPSPTWITFDQATRQIKLENPPASEGRRSYEVKVTRSAFKSSVNPVIGTTPTWTDDDKITVNTFC